MPITSLYHQTAAESAIDSFLRKSRFYSLTQRRWKLPQNYSKLIDTNFHTPFLNIISGILKYFHGDRTARGAREVVDTHTIDIAHREANSVVHFSRPGLVIKAVGPSFQLPFTKPGEKRQKVGYSNIATCIDIYVDGNVPPIREQLVKATIYARQIFIHQPNRRFARVLVLTEQHLRLFHFDRSGAQYTPPIDFHGNPHTMHGRKVGGTIKVHGPNGEDEFYKLVETTPFFCDNSIRGRATMCWNVRDPVTNEDLVVKDSWRTEDRLSEHLFMENAAGIPGVVQMVSCEPDRCDTKSLREFSDVVPAGFRNRIETRIVMKSYGKSIRKFTSAKQLFCALRDAIAGQMELFKRGTIHRDVSLQNVLLGKPGAEQGERGILIDFDISTLRHLKTPATRHMGTRLYQSVAVLYSNKYPHPLPHDHLDDLESFLYVLANIMFAYDSAGVPCPADRIIADWDKHEHDWYWVGTLKQAYLTYNYVPYPVLKRWPSPCVNLIIDYASFLQPVVQQKLGVSQVKPSARNGKDQAFAADFVQHYSHILALFDTAIEALDHPDTWDVVSDSSDGEYDDGCSDSSDTSLKIIRICSFPSPPQSQKSLKRSSTEDPSGQPPSKRTKSKSGHSHTLDAGRKSA
ncbi:hypothetical protein MD484_g7249, partial [Candolleomyces efflorescens]